MDAFFTNEQINEAVAALEAYSPGIWGKMKKMARIADFDDEKYEPEQTEIVRALTVVLPKVPFVAQAADKVEARTRLLIELRRAIRAEIDAADSRP